MHKLYHFTKDDFSYLTSLSAQYAPAITQSAVIAGYSTDVLDDRNMVSEILTAFMEDFTGQDQELPLIARLIKDGVQFDISNLPVMVFYKAVENKDEDLVKICLAKCENNPKKLKELVTFRRDFVMSTMEHTQGQSEPVTLDPNLSKDENSQRIASVLEKAIWNKHSEIAKLLISACSKVSPNALSIPNPLSQKTPYTLALKLELADVCTALHQASQSFGQAK